jgi:hypothetical protein
MNCKSDTNLKINKYIRKTLYRSTGLDKGWTLYKEIPDEGVARYVLLNNDNWMTEKCIVTNSEEGIITYLPPINVPTGVKLKIEPLIF